MLSAPIFETVSSIRLDEPCPISIIAMTAPTPITIPRHVKTERMMLRRKACREFRSGWEIAFITTLIYGSDPPRVVILLTRIVAGTSCEGENRRQAQSFGGLSEPAWAR